MFLELQTGTFVLHAAISNPLIHKIVAYEPLFLFGQPGQKNLKPTWALQSMRPKVTFIQQWKVWQKNLNIFIR